MSEESKALVRRLVDEAINAGNMDTVDELFAPELAGPVKRAFMAFRSGFPDWRGDRGFGRGRGQGSGTLQVLRDAPG